MRQPFFPTQPSPARSAQAFSMTGAMSRRRSSARSGSRAAQLGDERPAASASSPRGSRGRARSGPPRPRPGRRAAARRGYESASATTLRAPGRSRAGSSRSARCVRSQAMSASPARGQHAVERPGIERPGPRHAAPRGSPRARAASFTKAAVEGSRHACAHRRERHSDRDARRLERPKTGDIDIAPYHGRYGAKAGSARMGCVCRAPRSAGGGGRSCRATASRRSSGSRRTRWTSSSPTRPTSSRTAARPARRAGASSVDKGALGRLARRRRGPRVPDRVARRRCRRVLKPSGHALGLGHAARHLLHRLRHAGAGLPPAQHRHLVQAERLAEPGLPLLHPLHRDPAVGEPDRRRARWRTGSTTRR